MKLLINYANNIFRTSQQLNSKSGMETGAFDKVISYSPEDIDADFYNQNREILSQRRGNGYWLWKPYFIKKTLEMLKDGDFLFYCDAGAYFIQPITPIIDISLETGQNVMIFELDLMEKMWTKRDAFILMDCDRSEFTDSNQRLAGFTLWRKSNLAMEVAHEFLRFAQDKRIITDMKNQCGHPNYPGFIAHRHDQSIISLLTKKYGLGAYRDPSQWGNHIRKENSPYGQIIESTRARNENFFQKVMRKSYNVMRGIS